MKKLIGFAFSLALIVWACSKQEESVDSLAGQSPKLQKTSEHGVQWKINCVGTCASCDHIKVSDWKYQCDCTDDCKLQAIRIGYEPEATDLAAFEALVAQYGTFHAQLEKSVKERMGIPEYRVLSVDIYTKGSWYGVRYQLADAHNQNFSTAFYKTDAGAPGYEVDCTGSCISASAECLEEISLGDPPKINCACEGDCHLKVTPIEEPN